MKKQLQKKLYACLPVGMVFIVTAMLFSASANAQIVYTDIIPDETLLSGNYNLDLNNDGQSDFTFRVWYSFLSCGGVCSIRRDTTLIKPTGLSWVSDYTNGQAAKLNSGDSINASSPLWTNFQNQLLYNNNADCSVPNFCQPRIPAPHYLPSRGIWVNVVDKYLALKIQVSGNIYYGWARLDVGGDGLDITIKDYAYNSIPNQQILAGQTTITGINEISFASSISLYPNPATNHLTIALGSNNKKIQVTIADLTGKVIYTTIATDTQKVEVDTKDFAEGIYVVQIQSANFIGTKKLVIGK
jgi:hypothetical protein